MNHKHRISLCLGVLLLIGNYSAAPSLAQKSQATSSPQSAVENAKAPLYKIGRIGYSGPNRSRKVFIFISIEPESFVRDNMLALARKLNEAYSWEKRVLVIILDDYDAVRRSSPINNRELYEEAKRGYYYIDRTTGEEYIQFSTERGKPLDEVKINLGKGAI
jgi:hypothetical protein